jgi:N-acetylmuramoyl-L-alanine amidase
MVRKDSYLAINHGHGRKSAFPVDLIVIHVTEGNATSVVSWFNSPEAQVSAHYMVRKDGIVEQFVREADTAWHAGRVDHPTAELVIQRSPANPNSYSIGIEHEGNGHEELTDPQRKASIELLQDICMRRDIPQNRRHIVGHHEIYSKKTCPGAIDVDRLVAELCAAGVKA